MIDYINYSNYMKVTARVKKARTTNNPILPRFSPTDELFSVYPQWHLEFGSSFSLSASSASPEFL